MIKMIVFTIMIVAFWIMIIITNAILDSIGTIGVLIFLYMFMFFILLNQ